MELIATRSLKYGTRRLMPGDTFEASRMNGRLLIALKKATAAVDEFGKAAEQAGAVTKERRRSKRTKD